MTLLLMVLALTWSGLAVWTFVDHHACRCDRQLPPSKRPER
jgi:hypothetical protein